uniref:histidine phosphatase family protein n=1 Tax=Sporosarcina sp. FSL K6-1522 TaxID=2921554 RepID=UPI00406C3C1E
MLTTVGFVRHGITAWNKEGREQGSLDIPLDEEGIGMAKRVAERLAAEQWDIIYTSPLVRARRTAEIIAQRQQGMAFVVDQRLREPSSGQIEGTTEAERVAKWGEAWRELQLGGESHAAMLARGMEFMEELKEKYPKKRVLVVSHGGFLGHLLEWLLPEGKIAGDLANTSLTMVELSGGSNRCSLLNCTKHLRQLN